MNKAARRKWQDEQVAVHRQRYFKVVGESSQEWHFRSGNKIKFFGCAEEYQSADTEWLDDLDDIF